MADQNPSFTKWQAIVFVFTGALIAMVLIQAKLFAEHRPSWHTLELLAYEFLQTWAPPYEEPRKPLSVVVVDIGKMPGGKDENTSREALTHLIDTVVEQSPLAIAVDIDFSPSEDGLYRTDEDPKFFDFCREQKTTPRSTPIFLGVHENSTVSPDAWLGVPKYKDLAVNIAIDPMKTRRIPLWLQLNGWDDQLPSLSAALANVRGIRPANLPVWLHSAVDTSPRENEGYVYADILVDYTKLDDIKKETVVYTPVPDRPTPVLSKPESLKDKLVIIGDVTDAMDSFRVPGRDEGEFPGVYLHASAVHTLTTHPVFELTSKARLTVEIVVSGLIILGAAFIRYRYRMDPDLSNAYQKRLTISCFVLIVGAVIVLVRYYNVFWFDFHLALVGLFLHLKLERVVDAFHHFRERLKQSRRKQARRKQRKQTRRLSSHRS
jgi:CHASE2 domain-containing sensor protein